MRHSVARRGDHLRVRRRGRYLGPPAALVDERETSARHVTLGCEAVYLLTTCHLGAATTRARLLEQRPSVRQEAATKFDTGILPCHRCGDGTVGAPIRSVGPSTQVPSCCR